MDGMKVDITRLKTTRSGALPVKANGELNEPDFCAVAQVEGTAAQKGGGLFEFNGRITADVKVLCARCLAEVLLPYEAELCFAFCCGESTGEQDDETLIVTGSIMDLSEIIAGTIRADIPICVLCTEDCSGLCPVCGNNLNEKECNCEKELLNPVLKITDLK